MKSKSPQNVEFYTLCGCRLGSQLRTTHTRARLSPEVLFLGSTLSVPCSKVYHSGQKGTVRCRARPRVERPVVGSLVEATLVSSKHQRSHRNTPRLSWERALDQRLLKECG